LSGNISGADASAGALSAENPTLLCVSFCAVSSLDALHPIEESIEFEVEDERPYSSKHVANEIRRSRGIRPQRRGNLLEHVLGDVDWPEVIWGKIGIHFSSPLVSMIEIRVTTPSANMATAATRQPPRPTITTMNTHSLDRSLIRNPT
jgi:hypothetical protein